MPKGCVPQAFLYPSLQFACIVVVHLALLHKSAKGKGKGKAVVVGVRVVGV